MKLPRKKIGYALLISFIILQFFQIDKTNPPTDTTKEFVAVVNPPSEIATLMTNACYDCHSHETIYPWYTSIAPLSFLIRGHIRGGRQHLNFSEWGNLTAEEQKHAYQEMIEEVGTHYSMPMKSYTWLHSEAKLSEEDRQILVKWWKTQ